MTCADGCETRGNEEAEFYSDLFRGRMLTEAQVADAISIGYLLFESDFKPYASVVRACLRHEEHPRS